MSDDKILGRLIGLIYEAAIDPGLWPSVLNHIAEVMQASAASLDVYDPVQDALPIFAPRNNPQWMRDHWVSRNTLWQKNGSVPVGDIFRFENCVTREVFERSSFYNEWWRPQGMETARVTAIPTDAPASGIICFCRSWKKREFRHGPQNLLHALAPHLERAMLVHRRLAVSEGHCSDMLELLNRLPQAAFLVDAQAKIMFANRSAEKLLLEGDGVYLEQGRLATRRTHETRSLRTMILKAFQNCPDGPLVLPRDGRLSLIAMVLPARRPASSWLSGEPEIALLVGDPEQVRLPLVPELQSLFGMTAAQAMLAREILHGDGVSAAAHRLGISTATARTHLLAVFQKTGTCRQAELVGRLMQGLGNIASPPSGG